MITRFSCENIKAIKELSTFEIKPITIIMGENSSGKSSALQALSLLSVNKIFQGNEFTRIKYDNPFSKFGNTNEFKNQAEDVILGFTVIDDKGLEHWIVLFYKDDLDNEHYGVLQRINIKNNSMEISFDLINDNEFSISLEEFIKPHEDLFTKTFLKLKDKYFIHTNLRILTSISTSDKEQKNFQTIFKQFDKLNLLLHNYLHPLEILSENLKAIRHIGHIQNIDASYDYQSDYIGYFGEQYKQVAKSLKSFDFINRAVEKIFDYESTINEHTGDFEFYENEKKLNISMFGSSIASTVPHLTQIAKNFEYEDYRLTIIEEPEQNLHPLSQSKFIETVFTNYRNHNHHYVIETHSEHILNKLRYMVFKNIISSNDIIIYYKKRYEDFIEISLDKKGNFIDENEEKMKFPAGFFDATLDEIFEVEANNL